MSLRKEIETFIKQLREEAKHYARWSAEANDNGHYRGKSVAYSNDADRLQEILNKTVNGTDN